MRDLVLLPAALLSLLRAAPPGPAMICLANPSVEAVPGKASDAADAVRAAFTEYLSGPTITVKPLQSKLPSQAAAEAKQANCPFVLYTTVKHVHKSGGGGLGGKLIGGAVQGSSYAAGSVISSAVGGGAGQVIGGAAAGAASAGAMTAYAGTVKVKDELTLGTRLEGLNGKVMVERTDKRKAESDGEDLLSPIVQRAADQVATAVTAR
jgi:hypothetical protein